MPIDPVERRRASLQRNAHNAARLAFADFHFKVTQGSGLVVFPKGGDFGLSFAERPSVSSGIFLDIDELARTLAIDDADAIGFSCPTVTPMVTEWDLDEHGYYTGAWCAAMVLWPETITVPEDFVFYVDFLFSGIAIKDVDVGVRD